MGRLRRKGALSEFDLTSEPVAKLQQNDFARSQLEAAVLETLSLHLCLEGPPIPQNICPCGCGFGGILCYIFIYMYIYIYMLYIYIYISIIRNPQSCAKDPRRALGAKLSG